MPPKISIVVPVYNGEKTIGDCIKSLLLQDYYNFELIVVNNGSSDNTQAIINEYCVDSRLKVIQEPTRGCGRARNAGVKEAIGDIIAMTDADCVNTIDWLTKLCRPIIEEKESVTMGSEINLNDNFWSNGIQAADERYCAKCLEGNYIKTLDGENFAIKAELIKKYLYDDDLQYLEDWDLYLRLRPEVKIRWVPEAIVGHRHKTKFFDAVQVAFKRGYFAAKVYLKYRKNLDDSHEQMLRAFSLFNNLSFPFWMAKNFFIMTPGSAFFLAVNDSSWRAGMLFGLLTGKIAIKQ